MKKQNPKKAPMLFQSLSDIGDDLIEEARPGRAVKAAAPVKRVKSAKPKRTVWLRWGAAAACLCLIAAGSFAALSGRGTSQETTDTSTAFGGQTLEPFENAGLLPDSAMTGKASGSSQADSTVPFAQSRDFSAQRELLEEENVLPLMDDHPLFSCQATYNEDESLYSLQFTWSRRGETEDYSDLSILAGPQEIQRPSDCVVVETDEDGNPIPPSVVVTERDGISITTEGREGQKKTISFQNDSGWYQISGSWNDSFSAVNTLLDWLWEHPIDFQRFPMEAGDTYTVCTLEEYSGPFAQYVPDFSTIHFAVAENHLTLKNGMPVRFEGYFVPAEAKAKGDEDFSAAAAIHLCIDLEPDVYLLDRCIGTLKDLTQDSITEALTEAGRVSFLWSHPLGNACVTVFSERAQDVWTLLDALQQAQGDA